MAPVTWLLPCLSDQLFPLSLGLPEFGGRVLSAPAPTKEGEFELTPSALASSRYSSFLRTVSRAPVPVLGSVASNTIYLWLHLSSGAQKNDLYALQDCCEQEMS